MKRNVTLVISSVLSIVLLTIHITGDTVLGISPAAPEHLYAMAFLGLLLYAVLAHSDRAIGIVVMIFVGLFSFGMPLLHFRGMRINTIASSDGGFFFVWTLWALGVLGVAVTVLGARELWLRRRAS